MSFLLAGVLSLIMIATPTPSPEPGMTPERLFALISEIDPQARGQDNVAEFEWNGVPLMLVFDLQADRMRIISPITNTADLLPGQLEKAMEANFHTALDARYAVSEGVVWAVYVHPLSPLTDNQLRSAVRQVAIARETFGEEYTSGDFEFGVE